MSEETTDPDTSTEDQIGDLEIAAPEESVPVAEPAPPEAQPPGPRTFPQHYTLLLGFVFLLVGSISIWEREHIFGKDISGTTMISGTFLLAMAIYGILVSVLNIVHGRLRGMLAAFVTGVGALYLGIKAAFATFNQPLHLALGEINRYMDGKTLPDRAPFDKNPELFPAEVFDTMSDQKEVWGYWLGQWGPGVWWTTLGGAMIAFIFLKAFFPSKKAAEAAPPPRRRRR